MSKTYINLTDIIIIIISILFYQEAYISKKQQYSNLHTYIFTYIK